MKFRILGTVLVIVILIIVAAIFSSGNSDGEYNEGEETIEYIE